MDRGAWWATVHGNADSDMIKQLTHTRMLLEQSVQFNSVAHSRPTLCDPLNRSTPGLPVHHQLQELTQTHVHQVSEQTLKLLLTPIILINTLPGTQQVRDMET